MIGLDEKEVPSESDPDVTRFVILIWGDYHSFFGQFSFFVLRPYPQDKITSRSCCFTNKFSVHQV